MNMVPFLRIVLVTAFFSLASVGNPTHPPVQVFAKSTHTDTSAFRIELGLQIMQKGFRVEKQSIKVEVPEFTILKNELPPGQRLRNSETGKEVEVYEGAIRWPLVLSKQGQKNLRQWVKIAITYRLCSDKICFSPATKHLRLKLRQESTVHASLLGSLVRFWDLITRIDAASVRDLAAQHMWLALLLCFASGILTSLTPCVYPMIPITINIFGRMSSGNAGINRGFFDRRTFGVAGFYVAGMCVTYSTMGLVAGLTGSLFGKVLQSSLMLAFLTFLFLLLGLGQLGLFKIALPGWLQTKLASVGHTRNVLGVFIMGLFSGLIISPCVGPVIAGILAFVVDSSNAAVGFLYFLSFSLGLGILFLLIGGFSGALSQLPRSGSWMLRINRALACLLLLASGYYGLLWMKQLGWVNRSIPSAQSPGHSGIAWFSKEAEAFRHAKSTNQAVVIDFTAEWCEACHELERTVFANPKVIEKMKEFVPLRLDFTEDSADTRDKSLKYGVISLPTIRFAMPTGEVFEKQRVNGVVSPEQFIRLLENTAASLAAK